MGESPKKYFEKNLKFWNSENSMFPCRCCTCSMLVQSTEHWHCPWCGVLSSEVVCCVAGVELLSGRRRAQDSSCCYIPGMWPIVYVLCNWRIPCLEYCSSIADSLDDWLRHLLQALRVLLCLLVLSHCVSTLYFSSSLAHKSEWYTMIITVLSAGDAFFKTFTHWQY